MSAYTETKNRDQIQGKGDYQAAKRYQKAQHEFAKSGKVEEEAKEAVEYLKE